MLSRILEPEVMDTAADAIDYNCMDHSHVNRVFVDDLLHAMTIMPMPVGELAQVFDAGTGTALIPLELMRRSVNVCITASDLSEQMLILARDNVRATCFVNAIRLIRSDCKALPDADATYHVVMSNSIVHHIPSPVEVLAELWRILKPGGLLFVRDLLRPDDVATLVHLVQTYAGEANAHQRQLFRDSLHAALTVSEVSGLLSRVGIPSESVRATSDRHWTIVAFK